METSVRAFQRDFPRMLLRAALAYSRQLRWSDGRTQRQAFLERPQLLIENGKPTHRFFATAEGPGLDLKDATRTQHTVMPRTR